MAYSKERIALICLFIIELLSLTAFNLGNLAWGYRLIAFVLATICIIPLMTILKEKKAFKILLSIIFIYLYAIFSALFGASSPDDNIIKVSLILGTGAFFILGLFIGTFSDEKQIKNVISAFYIGLSLFVGLSLIVTIYHYGVPFYHVIYANEPGLYEVIQKSYIVIGFESARFDIQVLANYALILSTGVFGVFLISNDEKQKVFKLIICFSGLVGIITILCLAHSLHIYLFLFLGCTVYILKTWSNNKKHAKVAIISGVIGLIALIGINGLYRSNLLGIQSLLNNTKYLKNILLLATNFDERINHIKTVLKSITVFGHSTNEETFKTIKTGSLLFDALYNSGLVAFVCLLTFIVLQVIKSLHFYKKCRKNVVNQFFMLVIITTFTVLTFNSYILSTTLDFVLHGVLLLLGVMSAQTLKIKKEIKRNTNAKLNEA